MHSIFTITIHYPDNLFDLGISQINTNLLKTIQREYPALTENNLLNNPSLNIHPGTIVNDHRKLIHFLSKYDQSKLIHCFTRLLLLIAAYLSIDSFHRLIAVHANDEVNDQA